MFVSSSNNDPLEGVEYESNVEINGMPSTQLNVANGETTYVSTRAEFVAAGTWISEKHEAVFQYWEDVMEVLHDYQEKAGLPLKKGRSDKDPGRQTYAFAEFCCYYSKKSRAQGRGRLRECPFTLEVRRWQDGSCPEKVGKYVLKVKCVSHNHDFTPAILGTLGPSRKFSLAAKQLVRDSPGMKGVELAALIRENTGLAVTPKEISRVRETISVPTVVSDVESAVLFMEDKGMVHDCLLTSHNSNIHEVSIMIFATKESLASFRRFPQVLLVDTTYCTNVYDYPLLNFVAIDNHGVPFLAASALLYEETRLCYDWVLTAFVALAAVEVGEVRVILSDADLALRTAIRSSFPGSKSLLCRWHLGLNLKKSMDNKGSDTETCSSACNMFHTLSNVPEKKEFDTCLTEMKNTYPTSKEYMDKWNKCNEEWAEYQTKSYMKLGIDTTS